MWRYVTLSWHSLLLLLLLLLLTELDTGSHRAGGEVRCVFNRVELQRHPEDQRWNYRWAHRSSAPAELYICLDNHNQREKNNKGQIFMNSQLQVKQNALLLLLNIIIIYGSLEGHVRGVLFLNRFSLCLWPNNRWKKSSSSVKTWFFQEKNIFHLHFFFFRVKSREKIRRKKLLWVKQWKTVLQENLFSCVNGMKEI